MRFTTTWLDRIKPAPQRIDYTEDGHRGLMLRVFPSGEKSFVYRYQIDGARRYLTLGSYPSVSLAEAHARHLAALTHLLSGQDPAKLQEAKAAAELAAETVAAIIADWQTLYADRRRKRPEEARALLKSNLPAAFLEMRAKNVTKRDVVRLVLDPILKRGSPAVATDVGSLLKQIFAHAVDRETIPGSPLATLKKHGGKEKPRKRWLSDEEIAVVWHKLDDCGMQQYMRVALRLALVTAQRRVEIASMTWKDLDLFSNTWTIPEDIAKNEERHVVPLSPLALELLKQLKVFARGSDFVLPSYHRKTKQFRHVDERSITRAIRENEPVFGLPHFTPHDFRRTARTHMARLKVPQEVAELVLNHKKKEMVAVYDQWEYLEEKREALNKWAAHIEQVIRAKDDLSQPKG